MQVDLDTVMVDHGRTGMDESIIDPVDQPPPRDARRDAGVGNREIEDGQRLAQHALAGHIDHSGLGVAGVHRRAATVLAEAIDGVHLTCSSLSVGSGRAWFRQTLISGCDYGSGRVVTVTGDSP